MTKLSKLMREAAKRVYRADPTDEMMKFLIAEAERLDAGPKPHWEGDEDGQRRYRHGWLAACGGGVKG